MSRRRFSPAAVPGGSAASTRRRCSSAVRASSIDSSRSSPRVADEVLIVANDAARYAGFQLPVFPDLVPGAGRAGRRLHGARGGAPRAGRWCSPATCRSSRAALLERLIARRRTETSMRSCRARRAGSSRCAQSIEKRCAPAVRERESTRRAAGLGTGVDGLRVRELGPVALEPYDRRDGCSRMSTRRMITRAPDLG